jgi:hypothetical protein
MAVPLAFGHVAIATSCLHKDIASTDVNVVSHLFYKELESQIIWIL